MGPEANTCYHLARMREGDFIMMNRRTFGRQTGVALLALAAGGGISLTGCPTAGTVFTDILKWIPTAILAVNGIVTVLGAFMPPGAMVIIVLINAALNSLTGTITQYNNDTNPADKATLLAKIRTILNDIVTNFQSFLDQLNLGANPIVAIVIGLANVLLAAIAGFLGQLPVAGTAVLTTSFHVGATMVRVVPKLYKNVGEFKKDWNQVCISNHHPEIELY
jgi:hypothetical protein